MPSDAGLRLWPRTRYLIELDGEDRRLDPLEVRKSMLTAVIARAAPGLRLNEHMVEEDGPLVFRHARKLGLEGIVSKHRDSRYHSGRSRHWIAAMQNEPAKEKPMNKFEASKIREGLREQFEDIARWRREKAKEYPHDERSAQAATILDELATTVDSVDDQTLLAYAELFEGYEGHEDSNEMFRLVGFQSCPSTATEFIQAFVSRRTGSRWSSV